MRIGPFAFAVVFARRGPVGDIVGLEDWVGRIVFVMRDTQFVHPALGDCHDGQKERVGSFARSRMDSVTRDRKRLLPGHL